MRRILLGVIGLVVAAMLVVTIYIYSGAYNIAADEPHARITENLLATLRQRSVAVRADDIPVPDLNKASLIESGAEHYAAMCTGCHLAPGMTNTELRQGLYPAPPDFSEQGRTESFDPARAFWVIKHGIKLTGMPAWGTTHDDKSIWGLVAFVQKLPELSPEEYESMTAGSAGGHDHGDHAHGKSAPESEQSTDDGHSHEHDVNTASGGGHSHAKPDSAIGVLDSFHHALEEGRGKQALQYLAEDAIILEGGHAETREEYASGHLASDMAFLAAIDSTRLSREVRKSASGNQMTVVTRNRLRGSFRDKELDSVSSETALLEQREGAWKIVHLHWSN